MPLDLSQWRAFLAIAEHGSLMKAAVVLHTDQPALSRSLRRMERLIGAPLFDRSSRGASLTDLGRRLHEQARDLVTLADALEGRARAGARRTDGILRIGAIDLYPLTSAIAEASRDLTAAGRPIATEAVGLPWLGHIRALLDRTIDIGFTLTVDGRLDDLHRIRSRPLWEDTDIWALVSDHHPLATVQEIDPRDLADQPLHLPDEQANPGIRQLILEQLADAGLTAPRVAAPLGSMAVVIAQIAAGNGWTLSTRTLAEHPPAGVTAIPTSLSPSRTLRFEVIWHVDTDQAAVDAFIARLRHALDRRS